jgi:hypothetical protein
VRVPTGRDVWLNLGDAREGVGEGGKTCIGLGLVRSSDALQMDMGGSVRWR